MPIPVRANARTNQRKIPHHQIGALYTLLISVIAMSVESISNGCTILSVSASLHDVSVPLTKGRGFIKNSES